MRNLKLYKRYQNIPTFDIGKPTYSTGYQTGGQSYGDQFGIDKQANDYSGDANQYKRAASSTLTSGLINTGANIASQVGTIAATQAASKGGEAASGAAGAASSIAGYATGGLGLAMGGLGIADAIGNFGTALTGSQLSASSAKGKGSIGGIQYDIDLGVDTDSVMDLQKQYDKANNASLRTSSMTAGAGAGAIAGTAIGAGSAAAGGALAGSWAGPIGAAAGAALGLLFGSLFGGNHEDEMKEMINKQTIGADASNYQNEAAASSKAIRQQYSQSHGVADYGKNMGQSLGYGDISRIMTPNGPSTGAVQGMASPDEGSIDMSTGETQYHGNPNPNAQDPRVDNIPVGGNNFNENVAIPGHERDMEDGVMFADKARPYFKANEMIKMYQQQVQNRYEQFTQDNENHKHRNDATKEYMQKRADKQKEQADQLLQQQYQQNSQQIATIAQKQQQQQAVKEEMMNIQNYYMDRGKYLPMYNGGKLDLSGISNMTIASLPKQKLDNPLVGSFSQIGTAPSTSTWIEPIQHEVHSDANGNIMSQIGNMISQEGDTLLGIASRIPGLINERSIIGEKGDIPRISVSNKYAPAALQTLNNLYYNPSAEMRGLTQQQARNIYGIRNATNLSAGQKAALANTSNNQIRQARHDILVDAYNKNAQYKQAYANALLQAGEQQANRDYNAQAAYNDAYIKQNASYVSNLLAHNKNVQSAINQTLQDRSTKEFRDKMYDLWNRQLDNDNQKSNNQKSDGWVNKNMFNPYTSPLTGRTYGPVWSPKQIALTGIKDGFFGDQRDYRKPSPRSLAFDPKATH